MLANQLFFLDSDICLAPLTFHALASYKDWFSDPRLWSEKTVPKTQEEIKVWLFGVTCDKKNRYFSILSSGENIGHVGIKNIDLRNKTGELDLFLINHISSDRRRLATIFSWIRKFARTTLGLESLLLKLSRKEEERLKKFLGPLGFIRVNLNLKNKMATYLLSLE